MLVERPAITTRSEQADAELLDVIEDIHPKDWMYKSLPVEYFHIGRDALRCVELALFCAGADSPNRILDFGCGAGRVTRFLKPAFPEASLTVCDQFDWQLEFCERVFRVTAVEGRRDPENIELDGPFDLIWCGSVLTHTEAERWPNFLKLFESILSHRGVLVFTTYGRLIVNLLRTRKNLLNLTEEQAVAVLRDYDATGFGYQPTYYDGDCIASPAWVCTQLDSAPSLELLLYMEEEWDGQDVIACTKSAS